MARPKKKAEEPGITSAGAWLVTFTDCMTNLMTFFVMLVTFSSFDDADRERLSGVFNCAAQSTIFPSPREAKDSMVRPVDRVTNAAEDGSETATDPNDRSSTFPGKLTPIFDEDANKDRRVLYIPSQWLFWGQGTVLTEPGRQFLRRIASFLEMVPSRVVVGETGPVAQGGPEEAGLDRACAVARFLAAQGRLSAAYFNVTAGVPPVPEAMKGQRVLAVTMISQRTF